MDKNLFHNQSVELRRLIIASIYEAGSGHPGGALSAIDILNYLLCSNKFKKIKSNFILSKGHAAPAFYAAAAFNKWINLKELSKLRKIDSLLQGHPSIIQTPWVNSSTGSLGQGFSVAVGKALGFKHQNKIENIYVMLGDGEVQEGQVWEAAMCAAKFNLNNLCAIIDYNKLQSDDFNKSIMNIEPLKNKWEAFNWQVVEINGHDFDEIKIALEQKFPNSKKPFLIIAHTIKGKGISFMENVPAWHGSVKIKDEELVNALQELNTDKKKIEKFLDGTFWENDQ
jgi:transketolase